MLIGTIFVQFGVAELEVVFGRVHKEGVLLHIMSGSH
jgi:hypothetical protein